MRFTGSVPADSLGSERRRYAIACPDKLGADQMAYGVLNEYTDVAAELGRNPVSKHQIQPEALSYRRDRICS